MENMSPTPVPTPTGILTTSTQPQRRYGDRFIPTRAGNTWDLTSSMHFPLKNDCAANYNGNPKNSAHEEAEDNSPNGTSIYSSLLLNETLGYQLEVPGPKHKLPVNRKLFHYDTTERAALNDTHSRSPFSSSPISTKSETLCLRSQNTVTRPRIYPVHFKMLDAPLLQDDFYLNLIDWSALNFVCIGLGPRAYIWSAVANDVACICDFSSTNDTITSVAWNERGDLIALGTRRGYLHIWDATVQKLVYSVLVGVGRSGRVGVLAWNGSQISTGSQDGSINQKDFRKADPDSKNPYRTIESPQLTEHRLEVCGLKWSPDKQYLASGGNDNEVRIWSPHSNKPVQCCTGHVAAVKALAWSPHRHGLLASGGGTLDKCIRMWDTLTGLGLHKYDTGSQVCNLAWSKHGNELVSTHGFSQNDIVVWEYCYPTLKRIARLEGHISRVVYMAMSPDGEVIVTGAGGPDETLRFWKIFNKVNRRRGETPSALTLHRKL